VPGALVGVYVSGWGPVDEVVVEVGFPPLFGCLTVVVAAGNGEVFEVGWSAVGPVGQVMNLGFRSRFRTAGEGAALISGEEG